jgi:hypothetical protein
VYVLNIARSRGRQDLKSRIFLCLTFALAIALSLPAVTQNDLYNNGPTNGNTDAWTINFGFTVSNSFNLTSESTVQGINFAAWLLPGDILQTAEVSITSREFGGTTYFDQTVSFVQRDCISNQYAFNVCVETGSLGSGVNLNAGTYYLNLQNASVNTGDPIYWDENSGPSLASQNSVGTIPSESFTVLGTANTGTGTGSGSTPEPTNIMLFASGLLSAAGMFRRKLL